MKVDPSKKTTESAPIRVGARGLSLVLHVGDDVVVRDLPLAGAIDLGRDPDCGIPLDHESVSRHHARLHCAGESLEVEDLGSTNGTRVLGAALARGERRHVPIGAVLELGDVAAFVRPRGAVDAAPTTLLRTKKSQRAAEYQGAVLRSPRMRELYDLLDIVAPSPFPILILGETGVGKDVFAEMIHRRSPRAEGRLMRVNCAALAESLLESELFGHEKGAFTGAVTSKEGLFEAADGGTVFLDEIGEMPLSTQAKLLRVLESGEVLRVGSVRPKNVDVRFVGATNRDLPARCESGAFRSDLYYRLSGVVVTIPPLRERPEDVPGLAEHFAREANKRLGRSEGASFTPGALAKIERHDWPGNIRELRNTIERAVLLARGGTIDESHVTLQIGPRLAGGASPSTPPEAPAPLASAPQGASDGVASGGSRRALGTEIRELERKRVMEALEACGGNQSRAAKMLGMPRRSLLRRIEEFGLIRPRKQQSE